MKLFKRSFLTLFAVLLLTLTVFGAEAATKDEVYAEMLRNYQAQNRSFTITYTGDLSDLLDQDGKPLSCAALNRYMAASRTDGDIAMMNISAGVCFLSDRELTFAVTYLLDQEKLDFMEAKAKEIARELDLHSQRDYIKIKRIYEYVTENFSYDTDLEKYTDYDGVTTGEMVCQGYALLIYRLMTEAGIPCRIIAGTGRGEAHGWNAVQLRGIWYELDATWDAKNDDPYARWEYFLKAPGDFSGHTRAEAFSTEAFDTLCPPAEESFPVPQLSILLDGTRYGGLVIRTGQEKQLTTAASPNMKVPIQWESTDPSVVSVDERGRLVSLSPGEVYIIARAAMDESFFPARFKVTAVEMNSCSPWAKETLTEYYLQSLYPAELCGNYQQAITREEFAQLIYLLLEEVYPTTGTFLVPDFEDIADSPCWLGIIYTSVRRIFNGLDDVTFAPKSPLTREQAAKVISAVLDYFSAKNYSH